MEELLKELGYTDDQIKGIVDGMKNKKIYTSAEENIDTRYSKLNDDFKAKENELTTANNLIEELKKGTKGNEDLQQKVTDYEAEITKLKEEQHEKDVDNALKLELLKNKAKGDDIDYLIFKIKSKQEEGKEIDIDDKGNIKNFNVDDFKKEFESNFEDESKNLVDVKELGGKGQEPGGNKEPETMLDALKEKYIEKNEM